MSLSVLRAEAACGLPSQWYKTNSLGNMAEGQKGRYGHIRVSRQSSQMHVSSCPIRMWEKPLFTAYLREGLGWYSENELWFVWIKMTVRYLYRYKHGQTWDALYPIPHPSDTLAFWRSLGLRHNSKNWKTVKDPKIIIYTYSCNYIPYLHYSFIIITIFLYYM